MQLVLLVYFISDFATHRLLGQFAQELLSFGMAARGIISQTVLFRQYNAPLH